MLPLLREDDERHGVGASPLMQKPRNMAEAYTMEVLYAMNPDLIRALIDGNVFRTVMGNPRILPPQTISKNQERPCIYGHFFGSASDGSPPTPNQFLYMIEKAEKYYEPFTSNAPMKDLKDSIKIALAVDSSRGRPRSTQTQLERGQRYYAKGDKEGNANAQVKKALQWLKRMKEHIETIPEEVKFSFSFNNDLNIH